MTACRYTSRTTPRVIKNRHEDECASDECTGCLVCPEAHCRVCGVAHDTGTCADCLAATRDDLHAIGTMCPKLSAEVVHRGVDSEAMALLAPAADPEAWGHITTSLHVGRLPVGYLRCDRCNRPYPCEKHADGERHPSFILGGWEEVWRDALDHETDAVFTIAASVRYLDQQMTYMASFEDAPFEDFAADVRRCRAHLEAVLHDGEQRDEGAPCMRCETTLLQIREGRKLPWSKPERPALAHEDGWACPRCKTWHNEQQYRLAVTAMHMEKAPTLTGKQMFEQYGIPAGSVRGWASLGKVRKRGKSASGLTLYDVEDALAVRDAKARESINAG